MGCRFDDRGRPEGPMVRGNRALWRAHVMNDVDRVGESPLLVAAVVSALLVLAAAPYLAGGIGHAYFAGDDFDLLAANLALGWRRIFVLTSRGSYRPMIDLWYAGAAGACGMGSPCYHLLSLAVHLLS